MGVVDTGSLVKRARNMARDEFVARHANLYFVIAENPDQLAIGFQTAVVSDFSQLGQPAPGEVEFELLEVSKAPGNPYPERISIGRARNCDVVLRDPSVSKLHGHFRLADGDRLELVDLDSQNGTFINGRVLPPNAPEWVAAGDTLRFGTLSAKLVDANALFDLLQE